MAAVTLKSSVRSGSAVARNPLMTQACRPCHISSPTGLPVWRIAFAAIFSASPMVFAPARR